MTHPPSRIPFHYGWVIVFSGALTLFSCLGLARFAYGMLLPGMRTGLGLAFDQMGFVSTANFAGYLASVAMAPTLIRRFRPRSTIVLRLLLIAACILLISRSNGFGEVLALYTLIGVGSGFANIPTMVLVSHWFRREGRGRAAGLMIMGNGAAIIFSGFLIPALNRDLGAQGWRAGWLALGLISLGIAGVAGEVLRNDPDDLGLKPVGRVAHLPSREIAPKEPGSGARILVKLGLLYLLFGATYMVYGTFIVTTMVVEYGFPEARAGMYWSWVGFFSLFSGVGFCLLSDRIGRKGGLAVVFAIQTAACLLAGLKLGETALFLAVLLYGLSAFAIPTIMAAAVGDYLGLSRAAQAFSLITLFFAVGQTIGPGAAGVPAEATGTFTSAHLAAAALTLAAVVLAGSLPHPPSTAEQAN
jgi:MFS family permease